MSKLQHLLKAFQGLNLHYTQQFRSIPSQQQTFGASGSGNPFTRGDILRIAARVQKVKNPNATQPRPEHLLETKLKWLIQSLQNLDVPLHRRNFAPDVSYSLQPGYGTDTAPNAAPDSTQDSVYPSDLYQFAAHLASHFGCTHIVALGCRQAEKLMDLSPTFQIVGLDQASIVASCKKRFAIGNWIEWEPDAPSLPPIDPEIVKNSVIICADALEHLRLPEYLFELIYRLLETAPLALLSTPDRDLTGGFHISANLTNLAWTRRWTLLELKRLLVMSGFNLEFIGLMANNSPMRLKQNILAILANHQRPKRKPAPKNFEVVAILKSFNEADIIGPSLHHLIRNGIKPYLIDNWSSDGTVEIARSFLGKGLIGIEQYPPEGRNGILHWSPLLQRTEEVAHTLGANWYIHHDVDEYRESPWRGMTLRDGLYYADVCGFNAVDHTLINFQPIEDDFRAGTDFVQHFRYWDFGKRPGHFLRINAWKNTGQPVDLVKSGGHHARFSGQRVYPYKFLLRHYTFRTEDQARRKLAERQVSHPDEEGRWHIHYPLYKDVQSFIRNPKDLYIFNESFYSLFLLERLSGIGLPRDPTAR